MNRSSRDFEVFGNSPFRFTTAKVVNNSLMKVAFSLTIEGVKIGVGKGLNANCALVSEDFFAIRAPNKVSEILHF